MALYPPAVKRLIPPGPNDPRIKPRLVILHVADTEATSLHDYFNGPSGGVESHFYVRYDGTVEQYRDTAWQADANVMANDFAISIESQGLANGTWTAQQLAALKALILWCRTMHGIPLAVPKTWDGSGVGYHILFEDQWDQRHASCPGPKRIQQFKTVLVPWMASGTPQEDDDMTPDEARDAVLKADIIPAPAATGAGNVTPVTALKWAMEWSLAGRNAAQEALAIAKAQAAKGGPLTAAEIEDAMKDALAGGIQINVTATTKES